MQRVSLYRYVAESCHCARVTEPAIELGQFAKADEARNQHLKSHSPTEAREISSAQSVGAGLRSGLAACAAPLDARRALLASNRAVRPEPPSPLRCS